MNCSIVNGILCCSVWCSGDDELRKLELPDGDLWMPIAVKISSIIAVKEAGENDFIGVGKATIYTPNEHFIVDIKYDDMVQIWTSYDNL